MAHTLRKANAGSFKPGNPGGPGRPVGARSKLNELALALLHEDFAKHGADVIRRVRERKPEVYLASVVSLLPKQSQIEKRSPFGDVSDEELDLLEEHLAAVRAKTIKRLELVAGKEVEPKDATQPEVHQNRLRKCPVSLVLQHAIS
jgi:hypothetical protein